jgi:hypothetical protein
MVQEGLADVRRKFLIERAQASEAEIMLYD